MAALHSPPDALALGGGGILGEAWMNAVLAGIEQGGGFDARDCGAYIGTSAGSIVAAALAAGVAPAERLDLGGSPAADPAPDEHAPGAWGLGRALAAAADLGGAAAAPFAAPFAALALGAGAGAGAVMRRALLRNVRRGRHSLARLHAAVAEHAVRWDGRLRITAVELESGRRVVFGSADAPAVSVATAVCASCAIPGFFEPVAAAGRTYVDGGAWSPTNMDALAVQRRDRVLCLNPTGSLRSSGRPLAAAIGSVSRGVAAGEALALRHRGASVLSVSPDERSAAAMGANLMSPGPRTAVIEAGLAQGRALARGAGSRAA
jgi:NTE family protein